MTHTPNITNPSSRRPRIEVARSVLKVGDGRGFVVNGERDRLVITAGHCLPGLPPCHGMSYIHERTYKKLLGPLGRKKPTVWAAPATCGSG
jgi:hypothetical protein